MDTYRMVLKGMVPLLMHHDNIEAQDAEHAKGKTGGKAGDDRYPPDRWKTYLYLDEKRIVMPAANIMAALLKVGSAISIGGKKTLKSASTAVSFEDFYLPFLVGVKKMPINRADIEEVSGDFEDQRKAARGLGFEIQVAPCRVNNKRHIRTRPMFTLWQVEGKFTTLDDDLTHPRLKELFSLAGLKAGLGDWRPGSPSKPGQYGRFQAEITKA